MILQSLVSYYEALAAKGEIARSGWGKVRVQYALEIDGNGSLLSVLPLESTDDKGKPIPRYFEMPAPIKRTVKILPNFLWDNSAYILGTDSKGKPERAAQCFEAARELHLRLLGGSSDPFARAVYGFFSSWSPSEAVQHPIAAEVLEEMPAGANLTFMYNGMTPDTSRTLSEIWQHHYNGGDDGENSDVRMRCLVTGKETVPEPTHPSIMRVRGAQSSGAALVAFNAPAFCSYGKSQSYNAPMSKYAAFAYTTALNHLLSDSAHTQLVGDTTVVYWAETAEVQYQNAFRSFLGGSEVTDTDLRGVMAALASGKPVDFESLPLKPENRFYILGIAPNAARLSVRFFLRDNFGSFAKNLCEHYDRLHIVSDGRGKFDAIPLWALLNETVNQNSRDKSASPQLSGDTLRAILTGCRYPATLYQQTMLRIRAERNVNRGKAAIIKAYLLRNTENIELKEAATVSLNEQNNSTPYVLGRLFSVLENIQDSATGASTVKDRFFSSACATPSVVFPMMLKLKNSHMKVLMRTKPGMGVNLEKQVTDLMSRLDDGFPKHLSLDQQGVFLLGYYHQTQKRYEKSNADKNEEDK